MTTLAVTTDVPIEMRDGTTLYADVYVPTDLGGDPLPTVLMRTPYDKRTPKAELDIPSYVDRGYAVVIQDTRGRYASEGTHYHGRYEVEDGYDTLEWIAHQVWSNGRIGMTGLSYPAAVQCAAAISGSPYLASLFHVKAPSNYYLEGCRRGGNTLNYLMTGRFTWSCTSREATADATLAKAIQEDFEELPTWLARLPLRKGRTPFAPFGDTEQFFLDMQNQTEMSDFWTQHPLWMTEEFVDEFVDTAALFVGGWYDLYREDKFFPLLAGNKRGPIRLLMGPWGHKTCGRSLGEVDFGPDAELDATAYTELQLDWFDESLKNDQSHPRPPVAVFVMGGGSGSKTPDGLLDHGGSWRYAKEWPLPGTQFTPFYLQADGLLSLSPPELHDGQPEWVHDPESPVPSIGVTDFFKKSQSAWIHDPNSPVPSIGGTSFFMRPSAMRPRGVTDGWQEDELLVPYGPYDQRERRDVFGCTSDLPLCSRKDVLIFETPVLRETVEVTGLIEAMLWISSSAVDTDIIIKLIDVYPRSADYPHGFAMNLSDGVLRASYRNGFTERVPMEPGEIYRVHLSSELVYPTSNRFVVGHKIRLHIASSDYPTYDVNPGHGQPPTTFDVPIPTRNVIHHDSEHPSHIILPIIATA